MLHSLSSLNFLKDTESHMGKKNDSVWISKSNLTVKQVSIPQKCLLSTGRSNNSDIGCLGESFLINKYQDKSLLKSPFSMAYEISPFTSFIKMWKTIFWKQSVEQINPYSERLQHITYLQSMHGEVSNFGQMTTFIELLLVVLQLINLNMMW